MNISFIRISIQNLHKSLMFTQQFHFLKFSKLIKIDDTYITQILKISIFDDKWCMYHQFWSIFGLFKNEIIDENIGDWCILISKNSKMEHFVISVTYGTLLTKTCDMCHKSRCFRQQCPISLKQQNVPFLIFWVMHVSSILIDFWTFLKWHCWLKHRWFVHVNI